MTRRVRRPQALDPHRNQRAAELEREPRRHQRGGGVVAAERHGFAALDAQVDQKADRAAGAELVQERPHAVVGGQEPAPETRGAGAAPAIGDRVGLPAVDDGERQPQAPRGGRRDLPVAEMRGDEDERPSAAAARLDSRTGARPPRAGEVAVGDGLEVGIFGERRAEAAPDLARDAPPPLARWRAAARSPDCPGGAGASGTAARTTARAGRRTPSPVPGSSSRSTHQNSARARPCKRPDDQRAAPGAARVRLGACSAGARAVRLCRLIARSRRRCRAARHAAL